MVLIQKAFVVACMLDVACLLSPWVMGQVNDQTVAANAAGNSAASEDSAAIRLGELKRIGINRSQYRSSQDAPLDRKSVV